MFATSAAEDVGSRAAGVVFCLLLLGLEFALLVKQGHGYDKLSRRVDFNNVPNSYLSINIQTIGIPQASTPGPDWLICGCKSWPKYLGLSSKINVAKCKVSLYKSILST